MESLFWILLIYAFYCAIRGNVRTLYSLRWILSRASTKEHGRVEQKERYVILIPVLREQEVIEKNFKCFSALSGQYELIYITTQREEREEILFLSLIEKQLERMVGAISTEQAEELLSGYLPRSTIRKLIPMLINANPDSQKQLIRDAFQNKKHTRMYIKELIKKNGVSNVRIIDYPYADGIMAHQLNYAIERITEEGYPKETFILIYNADSYISSNILNTIEVAVREFPSVNVIQQSALFLENFNEFPSTIRGAFLGAVALLQSRWTLAHEIPRIMTQSRSRLGALFEGAHVVGHGLIIRLGTLARVGNFPTATINEDLPLGYLLRLAGEVIHPLPLLESAESPTTVRAMFTQYETWSYGTLSYPSYLRLAYSRKGMPVGKALLWATCYSFRSMSWLLSSAVWAFLLLYPFLSGHPAYFLLSTSIFLLYGPLCFLLLSCIYNDHRDEYYGFSAPTLSISPLVYLMTLPAYLTHSVGPIRALWKIIFATISTKTIIKQKTER